ncbi:MAG: hypothetical protein K2Y39_20070 [Candidatus Obscuribacterales bacterium]|nr:hypothetical protein [Candidatus Obscuribacterales bacterium]
MTLTDYIFAKTAQFIGSVIYEWTAKHANLVDRGILCRHGVMCGRECFDCRADLMDIAYIRRELEHIVALHDLNEIWEK